ncbi:MAG: ABC transporter permease, partial [Aestuariivirgaceae bacterium]
MTSVSLNDAEVASAPVRRWPAWSRGDAAKGLTLISPPTVFALALLAIPILSTVGYSFWTQNYLDIDKTLTLENYRQAWTEPIYRLLMMRSLWISTLVT